MKKKFLRGFRISKAAKVPAFRLFAANDRALI
jgi:hypothetical protein